MQLRGAVVVITGAGSGIGAAMARRFAADDWPIERLKAIAKASGTTLNDVVLAMCAGAIAHARIRRLYYGASDPKGGAVEHGARVFAQPTCHHRPEVYAGIGEAEAATLLRGFFAERR